MPNTGQPYEGYLEEMRAYGFNPLDRPTWEQWQAYHMAQARVTDRTEWESRTDKWRAAQDAMQAQGDCQCPST